MKDVTLQVSEAIELINQALNQVLPFMIVEGEIASFKVNQGKFAFFDIKDEAGSLGCFMMAFQLPFPLEDGMKVRITAQPKVTAWGKFSLTVREIVPVGEGSLKKAFELLKAKLEKEGLFDESRKRPLPKLPRRIGVVSSSQAAGYIDFLKILENRWGGLEIVLVDVPVQGSGAPTQLIGAMQYLNELSNPPEVIAVLRGGGSADDLSSFNHEGVVRAVSASRIPTIVGVGHEIDTSLADLVADRRAATPSNAAEILVPDKREVLMAAQRTVKTAENGVMTAIKVFEMDRLDALTHITERVEGEIAQKHEVLRLMRQTLTQLNPSAVLRRGYALVKHGGKVISSRQDVTIGEKIDIEVSDGTINAEVIS